jgi:hypothetical protein
MNLVHKHMATIWQSTCSKRWLTSAHSGHLVISDSNTVIVPAQKEMHMYLVFSYAWERELNLFVVRLDILP